MRHFLLFFLFAFANLQLSAANLDQFFYALGQIEASGNPKAYNAKENAVGIYQIGKLYFLDSGVKGVHSNCFEASFAKIVCVKYFERYEPNALKKLDFEALARLHNGGSNWRKHKAATDKYWRKVKKELDKIR